MLNRCANVNDIDNEYCMYSTHQSDDKVYICSYKLIYNTCNGVLNMIQFEGKTGEKNERGSNALERYTYITRLNRNKSTRVARSEDGRVVEQCLRKWAE